MAILITGGTGFLGRHLTRHLLQSGEKDLVLLDSVPNLVAIADVAAQVKVVAIIEGPAQIQSEQAPDRGFARAGDAHEDDDHSCPGGRREAKERVHFT